MKNLLKVVCLSSLTIMGCVIVDDVGEIWGQGGADNRLLGEWISIKSALGVAGVSANVSLNGAGDGLSVVSLNEQNELIAYEICRTYLISNNCFIVVKKPLLDACTQESLGMDFSSGLMRYDMTNSTSLVFFTLNTNGWAQIIDRGIKTKPVLRENPQILRENPQTSPSRAPQKIPRLTTSDLAVLASLGSNCWSEWEVWKKTKVEAEP